MIMLLRSTVASRFSSSICLPKATLMASMGRSACCLVSSAAGWDSFRLKGTARSLQVPTRVPLHGPCRVAGPPPCQGGAKTAPHTGPLGFA
jgi:hypothetical protein